MDRSTHRWVGGYMNEKTAYGFYTIPAALVIFSLVIFMTTEKKGSLDGRNRDAYIYPWSQGIFILLNDLDSAFIIDKCAY